MSEENKFAELDDDALEKVTGGDTETMQELFTYTSRQFFDILVKGGTVADLDKVMASVHETIVSYNTKEGKIMNIERPMIEAQLQALYDSFVDQLNNKKF